jgi:catechol 2,3-dioxygenase-like lactoylglutathione lyase family enzyme
MIDHMTLTVRDAARTRAFLEKALAPLGYRVLMEFEGSFGMGDEKPYLWIHGGGTPTHPMHVAFAARRRGDVDAFYEAALAAGAKDNGKPGLRPDYHPSYYAAFVFDPEDGHPLEAVCHRAEGTAATRKRAVAAPAPKRKVNARAAKKAPQAKPAKQRAPAKRSRRP